MLTLYMILVAFHMVAVVITGILWAYIDLVPKNNLRPHLRDIRAVHFGSIWLVAWFLGLAFAFERLGVPDIHWWAFPVGLGILVSLSSIAYIYPKPPDLDPFYYWTRGWPAVWAVAGMAGLVVCLLWTAAVIVLYALLAT
jgi:hypothetical protein